VEADESRHLSAEALTQSQVDSRFYWQLEAED
jgi:hypothetical protein